MSDQNVLTLIVVLVVSPQRLILMRSAVYGGLSPEVGVILDESTMLADIGGVAFGLRAGFFCSKKFIMQPKGTSRGGKLITTPSSLWEMERTPALSTRLH